MNSLVVYIWLPRNGQTRVRYHCYVSTPLSYEILFIEAADNVEFLISLMRLIDFDRVRFTFTHGDQPEWWGKGWREEVNR